MQVPVHILNELNRAVGAGCIGNGELEAAFVGGGPNGRHIIRYRGHERREVHLPHRRKVQLKSAVVANRFFKLGYNGFANRENNRIRTAGRAAAG